MTQPKRSRSSAYSDVLTTRDQEKPPSHMSNDNDDFPDSPMLIGTPDSESFEADMPPGNNKEDIHYNVPPEECRNMLPTSRKPLSAHDLELALRQPPSQEFQKLQVTRSASLVPEADVTEIQSERKHSPAEHRKVENYVDFPDTPTGINVTTHVPSLPSFENASALLLQTPKGRTNRADEMRKYLMAYLQQVSVDGSLTSPCTNVKEVLPFLNPELLSQQYTLLKVQTFVDQHVSEWRNVNVTLYMTCGEDSMPRLPVEVYEFSAMHNDLYYHIQYTKNPVTNRSNAIRNASPSLGMKHIPANFMQICDDYISTIVDNHLADFGKLCWKDDKEEFLPKLFMLMTSVEPKNDHEVKLLRDVFRLIVVTFIMSHALTIVEETKSFALGQMESYLGDGAYPKFTVPRVLNRQLKCIFYQCQHSIFLLVLESLHQILACSQRDEKKVAASIAVLGLCMVAEDQQKTIQLVMRTRSEMEHLDKLEAQRDADAACRDIDTLVEVVMRMFWCKYGRKPNPMLDTNQNVYEEMNFGDDKSVGFGRQVEVLVKDHGEYLDQQQLIEAPGTDLSGYSARVVAKFLKPLWTLGAS